MFGSRADEPDHGVTVIFTNCPTPRSNCLYPLGEDSPIKRVFWEKNLALVVSTTSGYGGGRHHRAAGPSDRKRRARLATESPRSGAHGKPVIFLPPKTLTARWSQLEQV